MSALIVLLCYWAWSYCCLTSFNNPYCSILIQYYLIFLHSNCCSSYAMTTAHLLVVPARYLALIPQQHDCSSAVLCILVETTHFHSFYSLTAVSRSSSVSFYCSVKYFCTFTPPTCSQFKCGSWHTKPQTTFSILSLHPNALVTSFWLSSRLEPPPQVFVSSSCSLQSQIEYSLICCLQIH